LRYTAKTKRIYLAYLSAAEIKHWLAQAPNAYQYAQLVFFLLSYS